MKKLLLFSLLIMAVSACNKKDDTIYTTQVLPPPVDYFNAGIFEGHFTLFWDYEYKSSVKYYIIERFPGNTRDTAEAFATQYPMPGFVIDTTYYFMIRVVDKSGTYSESKSLTVGD